MRRFLRYIYKNLLPSRISQSLDVFKHLRTQQVDGLKERRVLVLSPHPDDEIIGCGGTIYMYHQMGSETTVVYMTDGRKLNTRYKEDILVSMRREEAKRAASIVGIDRLVFLDNKDSELTASPKTIQEVSEILVDLKPEAVFLPFLMDRHHDHIATSRIFSFASKSLTSCMCYSYSIWTPLPTCNIVSDITSCIEIKILALSEYKSQLELIDMIETKKGISKYYSVMYGRNGYAELFLACPLNEYRRLAEVIEQKL